MKDKILDELMENYGLEIAISVNKGIEKYIIVDFETKEEIEKRGEEA